MARTPLSSVDTAWLRMEDPTNLMMITGVMIFRAPLDMERLKATVEARLLRFDRFKQRVVPPRILFSKYYWQVDPGFDLDRHVQRVTLPVPGDQAALQAVVSELMSTPLDYSKPLWEMHLVEQFRDGCALIVRLHHCIADGIALVRVLLSITDNDPDAPWPEATGAAQPGNDRNWLSVLLGPARRGLKSASRITQTVLQESQEVNDDPARALELARIGPQFAAALSRLLLLWPDPKTLFKGPLGVEKRAAWSAPIPLAEVKAAGRAIGGTVNDVLLTAVTGALRRYIQDRGDPVENLNFRAVVPVNLRPQDEELTLGNRFGLVFLSLPVGIDDPIERLKELKRRMDAIKGTPEAMVAFGILNAIGMGPAEIQDIVVNIFGTKGTGVMTNVPGPRGTIYLAGAPLDTIMFWVPQSGRLGLGVSILSYDGKVWLGIATDEGLAPDPESIISAFQVELEELLTMTQQMDATACAPSKPQTDDTVETILTHLDQAITRVSVLVAEVEARSKAVPQSASDRCQAVTKTGQPCRNRPLHDARFCRVHQDQAEPPSV